MYYSKIEEIYAIYLLHHVNLCRSFFRSLPYLHMIKAPSRASTLRLVIMQGTRKWEGLANSSSFQSSVEALLGSTNRSELGIMGVHMRELWSARGNAA